MEIFEFIYYTIYREYFKSQTFKNLEWYVYIKFNAQSFSLILLSQEGFLKNDRNY